jgi:hypothetical protein
MNEKNIIKRSFKLRILPNLASFEDINIGPILSPFISREKINIFCNDFNNNTKFHINELKLSVIFYLNIDNSFFYIIKGPRLSELFKMVITINNLYNSDLENFLYLTELYDFLYYKYNIFLNNDFFFKNFFFNNLYSFKNLLIKKNENF